jgi:hypothetical protein
MRDLAEYPLMTENVEVIGGMVPSAPATGAGTQLGNVVESALREVLGWRPQAGNSRGFAAALKGCIELREVEGHVEWSWQARSYAVQADMGALTGAQASLYTRAKATLDQMLPLLDGLLPLRPDADPEDLTAIRYIVRNELSELVEELGVEGGPRMARVDGLFDLLLGKGIDPTLLMNADLFLRRAQEHAPAKWGQMIKLAHRFGLAREQVNTLTEEQNFTNYLIVLDGLCGLKMGCDAVRDALSGTGTPFLGTHLVKLSRLLGVIAESVREARFTMDSVFMGAAERQITLLHYDDKRTIAVDSLLDWVERVTTTDAPRMINDAGKDGVQAIEPILDELACLLRGALLCEAGGQQSLKMRRGQSLPEGYTRPRVQRAMRELALYMAEAQDLAQRITYRERPDAAGLQRRLGRDEQRVQHLEGRMHQVDAAVHRVQADVDDLQSVVDDPQDDRAAIATGVEEPKAPVTGVSSDLTGTLNDLIKMMKYMQQDLLDLRRRIDDPEYPPAPTALLVISDVKDESGQPEQSSESSDQDMSDRDGSK